MNRQPFSYKDFAPTELATNRQPLAIKISLSRSRGVCLRWPLKGGLANLSRRNPVVAEEGGSEASLHKLRLKRFDAIGCACSRFWLFCSSPRLR
jgi:hypothetical protein